ncbi:CMP-N-acetylneuraminate-beta-galactosamide-alpha-2,3-sialyltransferase 4-like, partial [Tachyglossus aculeatus]|uniref:CMP-N-acetylneuraminate-beta-galactosamide- alpha-2,3-sialyltransferase 4-like n=1 Tax=Tachyglossus aculeatus TaxID=9261 RepID=UPI0018F27B93
CFPGWNILLLMLLLGAVLTFFSMSHQDRFLLPIQEEQPDKACVQGEAGRKAAQIIGNYSQDEPVFLRLKDYFWSKKPSMYQLPYGTKGSENLLLPALALINSALPESFQSLKCHRCVVVGNGNRLIDSHLGDAIDQYDVVLRLNNAPVYGYKRDVGSKTTMRLFYPESAYFHPRENNADTLLVLVPFKAADFQWVTITLADKKRVLRGFWKQPPIIWKSNPEYVRILNPFFMRLTATRLLGLPHKPSHKVRQGGKPTTGLMAITLALHLCDLVHIAGFGYPDPSNKNQSIHYYEKVMPKAMKLSGHNVSQEALAIKQLLDIKAIKNLTYF